MSEAEFSAYLSLLSRLLKISPAQRAEIQDELRDHLELRLKELIAAGHPREAAVGLALADLGDAAGLAREFQSLAFRKQRRRWLRWTMASLAGTAALVLAVINLFPFQQAEPLNRRFVVMAQSDGPPATPIHPVAAGEAGSSVFVQTPPPIPTPSQVRIERPVVAVLPETEAHTQLEHPLPDPITWDQIPFQEALGQLEDWAGVEIYIHPYARGAFTDLNQTITLNINRSGQLSLRAVLTMLLGQLDPDLSFAVRNNMVVILPREDTADLRIYDCRDFLPASCLAAGEAAGTMPYFTFQKYSGAAMGGQSNSGASGMPPVNPAGSMGGPGGGTGTPSIHPPSQTGLVELLSSAVQPTSWLETGGEGTIYEYRGLLIIKQLPEVHAEVGNLIDQIRSLIKANGGSTPADTAWSLKYFHLKQGEHLTLDHTGVPSVGGAGFLVPGSGGPAPVLPDPQSAEPQTPQPHAPQPQAPVLGLPVDPNQPGTPVLFPGAPGGVLPQAVEPGVPVFPTPPVIPVDVVPVEAAPPVPQAPPSAPQ